MTYQYPQVPEPKKSKTWLWILLAVIGTILALCLVGALVVGGAASSVDSSSHKALATTSAPTVYSTEDTTEDSGLPLPKLSDFKLTYKVTDKQCFESAGCVETVVAKVETSLTDEQLAGTYELTYQITGIKDSPLISTIEITDGEYYTDSSVVELKSSKSKITVKATELEKQ
jgi:hypothetical protein